MEPLAGRYRTVRRIGCGGMAEVLEAVAVGDSGFSRRVAIKRILPEHVADESIARMFLDEARIASRLHHANIVGVLDYGILDGIPFQVLEFVDGLDANHLRERGLAKGSPIAPEIALQLCREVAHALQHAHDACDEDGRVLGIVHRDVNPKNILVSWGGDVKLTDFGIAIARDRTERTMAGQAKGTLSYMAPEQATAGDVDARTDVFALGCALHALLAGRSPMAGEDRLAALLAGVEAPMDPVVPADVAAIVRRAIARSKADRYRSAGEMAEALGSALMMRTQRDSRSLLREWLATLRDPAGETATATSSAAMQLVFAERRGTVRVFQTSAEPAVGTSTIVPVSAARSRVPDAPRRRVPFVMLAGLAATAAAFVGLRFLPERGDSLTALTTVTTPAHTAPPAPTETAEAQELSPAATPARVTRPPAPKPSSTKALATAPERTGTGVVVIGGERVHRAEIRVDGISKGYAPKTLVLPSGEHLIELRNADGKVLARRTVEVSSRQTAASPLRWIVGD